MPLYEYTAVTLNGETVKGQREAVDKLDLQTQLTSDGLFLTRWKMQTSHWSEPIRKYVALIMTQGVVPNPKFWIIGACLLTAIASCFSGVGFDRHVVTTDPPPAIVKKIQKIQEGMTRKEVELLFHTYPSSAQRPSVSRYFEPPNTIIEVSYQLATSPRSQDTVKGVLSVYPAKR